METADQITARIVELLLKIEKKIDQIEAMINRILSAIPGVLSFIVNKVRDAWNKMLVKLGEFWDWFVDKLTYLGNPFVLNGAADGWKKMGGKVARINDTITDLNLSVDDRWTGFAADQYKQSIDPQRNANTSIMSDFAENIADAMTGLANAIVAFWVGVAVAIIALLSALAGAAVATGSIIGLPAVPVLIVLGIVGFLAAAGGGVLILYIAAGSSKSAMDSTTAGITAWPKIATQ
jgi:hypothetical protein